MDNLRQLDLNLLVTLDALLAEHNVTRAAERLHYSQPSVSVQLARLRQIFGDPLLLPGPRGMRPTARADELREPLRLALESLLGAISPARPFDPAASSHTWRIAAADYGASTIVLPALPGLRAAAPGARLAILPLQPSRITRQAEQGEIDLALHTADGAPPGLHRQTLFAERYVLVGRAGHPQLRKRPTLAQFCKLDYVLVSSEAGAFRGITDEALARLGQNRRVALSVPHFLYARSVVAGTDLVAMLPSRLVRDRRGLRVCEAPLEVPGYDMVMLWHERRHRDPAHQWLRQRIAAAA